MKLTKPTTPPKVLADRAGVSPDVRVVRLRRTISSQGTEGHRGRDWHHRCVVRMPSGGTAASGQHKVIYRSPYVKGPSDKPFLHGETVWAPVR